ncbi:hypothetical protein F5888DRAFT_1631088 [Russula emetica]|nr:hypothetical protein F5888DRAFT_1631088 [Russula emetica]
MSFFRVPAWAWALVGATHWLCLNRLCASATDLTLERCYSVKTLLAQDTGVLLRLALPTYEHSYHTVTSVSDSWDSFEFNFVNPFARDDYSDSDWEAGEELELEETTDDGDTLHVPALQAQNQKLLGIIREMGARMEAEEQQLEHSVMPMMLKIQAFTKERDSLKALLMQAEHNNVGKDSHVSLAEIQQQFDAYRLTTQGQRETRDCRRSLQDVTGATDTRLDDLTRRNRDLYERFTAGDIEYAELDACNEHVARLEEENRRWQGRNSQLLRKYGCVHPTEFQSLKDEIESLKGEKLAWETERATHTSHSTEQQEI